MEIVELLKYAAFGAGAGATAAATGYLKQFKDSGAKWEEFDPVKFMSTIFIGSAIGAFAGFMQWPVESAEEFLVTWGLMAALSYYADALAKAIKRRLLDPAWTALKAKLSG